MAGNSGGFFTNSRNFNIYGGTFSDTSRRGMNGMQYLHQSIASGAMHDSDARYDPPKCHPKTRTWILDSIMKLVRAEDRNTKILWLSSPAGAGKSAIAQTICEMSAESRHLAASFFFSRTDSTRNSPTHLFSTIAYQIAMHSPHFRSHLESIMERDPSILTKSMDIQLQQLILLPIQLITNGEAIPPPVIIDGLDECINEKQTHILQLISKAVSTKGFPLCVLVSSRPERHLMDEFEQEYISKLFHELSLTTTTTTYSDIRLVLESGFLKILESSTHRDTMKGIVRPWPSKAILDELVSRISGQFIYAATVLKYVDNPDSRPINQLETILQ
ncbi:hypothetical protein BDQ12DRAFT_748739, partial [Crucibulum laeve]